MPDILKSAQDTKLLPPQTADPGLVDINLPYSARGGNLPPEPQPMPVPAPVGKKHSGSKSLMLAVLLFLLATLPLAVYFTSQQRQLADLRGKAMDWEGEGGGGPYPKLCPYNCVPQSQCKSGGANLGLGYGDCGAAAGEYCCESKASPTPKCVPDGQCMTSSTACCGASYADTSCGYSIPIRCGSKPPSGTTTPPPGDGGPPPTSPPPPGTTPPPGDGGPPPTSPPPPGTTPPPTAGPQCKNIKLYRNDAPVTPPDLQPGDQVKIAIVGANATKARVRVNGSTWTETSAKNPSGEFVIQFTVPSSGGTFTIEAEVHQNGVWQ